MLGLFKKYRKLTPQELDELREIHRCTAFERYKANHIQGNTALIPNGQKVAEEQEAITAVLERSREDFINRKLAELGYRAGTRASIDLKTGNIIIKQDDRPKDSK